MKQWARLGLVLAGLGVGLVVIEGVLTLWLAGERGPWEMLPEAGSPFVFRLAGDAGDPGVGILPARPVARSPAPGSLRVLSYGDSVAAGFGTRAELAYPSRLEAELAARDDGASVEVLNMVRGHSPSIYAQHLRHDVPRLSPDAVLIEIELVNDLADEAQVRNAAPASDGLPERIERARYLVGFDGHLLAPLAWRGTGVERTKTYALASHAWGRVLDRLDPNPIFAPGSDETYYARRFDRHRLGADEIERAVERLFGVLEATRDALAARDIALAVVVVPSRHAFEGGPLRGHGRRLVERARAELERRGIAHVSLQTPLEAAGGEALYLDFCHPNEAGHAAIASALADSIQAGLLGPEFMPQRTARADGLRGR